MSRIHELPSTPFEWRRLVGKCQLDSDSIYMTSFGLNSASKITLNQFLLLRALYHKLQKQCKLYNSRETWFKKSALDAAYAILQQNDSWKTYITAVAQQKMNVPHPSPCYLKCVGEFSGVYYSHRQIVLAGPIDNAGYERETFSPPLPQRALRSRTNQLMETPSRPPPAMPTTPSRPPLAMRKTPPQPSTLDPHWGNMICQAQVDVESDTPGSESIEAPGFLSPASPMTREEAMTMKADTDEQVVNMSLICFLQILSMMHMDVRAHWTIERHRFAVGNGTHQIYIACVDGYLQSSRSEVKAILEVKPFYRSSNAAAIRMQETAQMAAWISTYPPDVNQMRREGTQERRLLISQDMAEIYFTLAEFDADYVDYITGKNPVVKSFLSMHEFGPFTLTDARQMQAFGHLVLAFTLDHELTVGRPSGMPTSSM